MNDRDMYYSGYNYGGFTPLNNIPNNMPPMMNNQYPIDQFNQPQPELTINNYANSQLNDMNERINRLERQVKRLDQRLTRLETPYANKNYNNEPDNNMYMM